MAFRLPKVDSATFRAALSFVETFLGGVLVLFLDPNFHTLVQQYVPNALPVIAAATGAISLIINILRTDVANY